MTAFDYTAEGFSEERFRECGAMVAVVMNYDKRGLVGRAVECAFAQDWPCYEILAIDDASTDGSGEEMLSSVRRCVEANPAKAVRARVVMNDVNVGVLGQWRRVVALSGGRWFGMFGADDEAMPCRMRKAAEMIAATPGAVAVCTNYVEDKSGKGFPIRGRFEKKPGDYSWPGPETVLGCTAFWRRDVLELDLPDGNMDDFVLTWLAVISKKGSLAWDLDAVTVRYGVGTGVTTMDRRGVDDSARSPVALYRKYRAIVRRGRRFGRGVWEKIRLFDESHGNDAVLSRQIRGHWVASWTEGGGWFERLAAVWTMLVVDRGNDYGGMRKELVGRTMRRFGARFFGAASFVPLLWLSSSLRENANG